MRRTRTLALLAGIPWMFDFRRGAAYPLQAQTHTLARSLAPLFNEWDEAACWGLWHEQLSYEDYTDEGRVNTDDAQENAKKHAIAVQPSLQMTELILSRQSVHLPEPAHGVDVLSTVSMLLHLSLHRQALCSFHDDVVQLKPSPSVGARHGIEAFVSIANNNFYYDCAEHALVPLPAHLGVLEQKDGLEIHLFFRPDVYMWRYESGNCLVDVYLDLGHVIGNMSLATYIIGCSPPTLTSPSMMPNFNVGAIVPLVTLHIQD